MFRTVNGGKDGAAHLRPLTRDSSWADDQLAARACPAHLTTAHADDCANEFAKGHADARAYSIS